MLESELDSRERVVVKGPKPAEEEERVSSVSVLGVREVRLEVSQGRGGRGGEVEEVSSVSVLGVREVRLEVSHGRGRGGILEWDAGYGEWVVVVGRIGF